REAMRSQISYKTVTFSRHDRRYPPLKSRQSLGPVRGRFSCHAGCLEYLNVQVLDARAQGVAIEAEELCSPNLIPAGRRQSCRDQRLLHFADDAVIEPRRRQIAPMPGEVAAKVVFHELRKRSVFVGAPFVDARRRERLAEFSVHDFRGDRILRIEGDEPAYQVLQLPDVTGPGVPLQPLQRRRFLDLLDMAAAGS